MKKLWCLLPLLVFSAISANTAKADHGYGFGLGYVFGQGYGSQLNGFNSVIRNYTPPYFSLHPPVYYGKRYTRPYGASPFAAWPQLQANSAYAPQVHPDRNQIIANPHVPCAAGCSCGDCVAAAKSSGVKQLTKPVMPLVIDNPYYKEAIRYTSKAVESAK